MNKRAQALGLFSVMVSGLAVLIGSSALSATTPPKLSSELPRTAASAAETYIIRYIEPPLAQYDGGVQNLAAIPRRTGADGKGRLDVHSVEATAYIAHIQNLQSNRVTAMQNLLGHPIPVRIQMQHALNAVVADLTAEEVKQVRRMEGVDAIERDSYVPLATDSGPGFIGAATVWWGANAGQDTMFASSFDDDIGTGGQGVVIGDIDTGYNSASPSFAATDDRGYTIQNPLGTGHFLGHCSLATSASAPCNDKVIGRYDEISLITTPLPAMAAYTVEDTDGHGSHTASTSGGNARTATIRDYTTRISGVAPHANLVIYRACDANGCKQSVTSASVNQAIADGVVDVLTYSISGGSDVWNDSTSQAFLSAVATGIFVAAAGGNTTPTVPNPLPGTVDHLEPWVLTVAASTHQNKAQGGRMSVTGPGTPPANTQNLTLTEASGTAYTHFSATIPGTTPLILSPNFHANDTMGTDGCSAYPAGRFAGGIALLSRGSCCFKMKVRNAVTAGAVAVVIANNRPENSLSLTISASTADCAVAGNITTPVFSSTQSDGIALQTFLTTAVGATAQIPYHYERTPTQPDTLASFSLLGPGEVNVIKPEVQAPGVSILAAVARNGGDATRVDFLNGTSMATPHAAGAAALIIAAHPFWAPMEVKSALMMTAKESGLTKVDGMALSDAFDRGAGRIQVDLANKTGLVMPETNFLAYKFGADMKTLNMPSIQDSNCVTPTTPPTPAVTSTKTCSFTRTFRSVEPSATTQWQVSLAGVTGSVSPATFTISPGSTQSIDIHIDATAYATNGAYHFGNLVLTPTTNPRLPPLHLPVAVAVQPPQFYTGSTYVQVDLPSGASSGGQNFTVTNAGGPTLTISNTNYTDTAAHAYIVVNQTVPHVNNGRASSFLTDFMSGLYMADDFTVSTDSTTLSVAQISRIKAMGFMTGTHPLASLAGHRIHFEIYADNAGAPAGAPEPIADPADPSLTISPGDPGNSLPIWSYVGTIGTPAPMPMSPAVVSNGGLTVTSGGTDEIVLDLQSSAYTGDPTNLSGGKYWLLVYPETTFGTTAMPVDKLWAWANAKSGSGSPWMSFAPAVVGPTDPNPVWETDDAAGGVLRIEQQVTCGASWLSVTQPTLSLPGMISGQLHVNVDGSMVPFGHKVGYLCLQSNDTANPISIIRVDAYRH